MNAKLRKISDIYYLCVKDDAKFELKFGDRGVYGRGYAGALRWNGSFVCDYWIKSDGAHESYRTSSEEHRLWTLNSAIENAESKIDLILRETSRCPPSRRYN